MFDTKYIKYDQMIFRFILCVKSGKVLIALNEISTSLENAMQAKNILQEHNIKNGHNVEYVIINKNQYYKLLNQYGYYPCISDSSGKICRKISNRIMSRTQAEDYLKSHSSTKWLNCEAIPKSIHTPNLY
jgi:hypothetical protein